jgi:ATP-dependent helicase HrpB
MSVRLRDLLGTDTHPTVAGVPVSVELLSPAGRPLQRTADLPGFWRGSYAQVRAEMRGRYPKHPWPERPWEPG